MLVVLSQNKRGIGEYSEIEVHQDTIYGYGGNREVSSRAFLGEYKTEKRATQVFKEMVELIKANLHNEMYRNQPDGMYNCDPYFYEMPEE